MVSVVISTRHDSDQRSSAANRNGGSPGWFGSMTLLWVVFFVLMGTGRLHDLWAGIRDLPALVEVLVWIALLPWVLATAVWTSDWDQWGRIVVLVLIVAFWTLISLPRPGGRRSC